MPPVQQRSTLATFLRENWNNLAFLAGFIVLAWQLAPKFLPSSAGTKVPPKEETWPAAAPQPAPEPAVPQPPPPSPAQPAMDPDSTKEPQITKQPADGSADVPLPRAPVTTAPAKAEQIAPPPSRYSVRFGAATVSGRLPVEAVQKGARTTRGQIGLCYEAGLARNPALQGRVGIRFVIGRDGTVSNVSQGSSDLADNGVISCVVKAFYGLSFPKPESGIVTVTYPVIFSPG